MGLPLIIDAEECTNGGSRCQGPSNYGNFPAGPGRGKKPGSRRGADRAGFQPAIGHSRSCLKHAPRGGQRIYRSLFIRALTRRLTIHSARGTRSAALPAAPIIIDHRNLVQFETGCQLADELQKPFHFRIDRACVPGDDTFVPGDDTLE